MDDCNEQPCDCSCGDLLPSSIAFTIVDMTSGEELRSMLECPYGDTVEFDGECISWPPLHLSE